MGCLALTGGFNTLFFFFLVLDELYFCSCTRQATEDRGPGWKLTVPRFFFGVVTLSTCRRGRDISFATAQRRMQCTCFLRVREARKYL